MSTPIRPSALLYHNTTQRTAVTRLRARVQDVQNQAVTGLAIDSPSDAPDVWPYVHGLVDSIGDQETFAQNAERARSILGTADNALGEASNVLSEARALAVRFSNEPFGQEERDNATVEVQGLRQTLVRLANTDFGGRYVFAGEAYDGLAFDDAGAYLGTTGIPTTSAGPGDELQTGFDGSAVFGAALSALDDLGTALAAGDMAGINDGIDAVGSALGGVIETRTDAGVQYTRAVDVIDVSESLRLALQQAVSNEVDADPFATFQEFTELSQHLEATLQLTAASNSMRGLFERI